LYLHVDDADAMYERALTAGVEPIESIWNPWWGGRQFTMQDPDGTWWTVYQSD
jgi:PhnB protein